LDLKRETGYSTLVLTSVILLMVLVVALGSYRSIFQYFRIVEHRVMAMQQDWQVEGAIECVFAQSKVGQLFPLDVDECEADVGQLNITGHLVKRIHSISGFSALERHFILPSANSTGAVKASTNLILSLDASFMPDPGALDEDLNWQCTSIRYRNQFLAPSVTTFHPYQLSLTPYAGFPSSQVQQQRCADNYHSVGRSSNSTQHDFYHDSELRPFEDLFGVDESNWFEVFANAQVGRIPLSLDTHGALDTLSAEPLPEAQFNPDCANDIVSRIEQGNDLIWVYGGCELNEAAISNINQAISRQFNDSGIILVIHNGLLAIESQQIFQGLVMQFTSPGSALVSFSDWQETTLESEVSYFMAHSSNVYLQDPAQISYFQIGRFNPLGGLVLSSTNSYAVVEGQLNFQFQRDLIAKPLSHIRPTRWLFGSWGDEYANNN
jgi:hypothetical protein